MVSFNTMICRAFELWSHCILSNKYELDEVKEEPFLRLYILKAKRMEQLYSNYVKWTNMSAKDHEMFIDGLVKEAMMLENNQLEEKQIQNALTFPFNQVSEGLFMAYLLEVFNNKAINTYASRFNKTALQENIGRLANLKMLISIMQTDFSIDVTSVGLSAKGILKIGLKN
jgi:hypothetical protein